MSPKEADKVIKAGKPITVYNDYFRETITFIPVSRDRWNIIGSKGEKFDRGELKILKENPDTGLYYPKKGSAEAKAWAKDMQKLKKAKKRRR
jgi:hypothetical protein